MANGDDLPKPEEVSGFVWTLSENERELRDFYRSRAREDEGLANAHEELLEPLQALGTALRPELLVRLRESDPARYAMFTLALASNCASTAGLVRETRELTARSVHNFSVAASGGAIVDLGFAIIEEFGEQRLSFSRPALDRMLTDPSRAKLRAFLEAKGSGFGRMLEGCWETFHGPGPDRLRQAVVSMRELIRMLLDALAPRDDVAVKLELKPKEMPDGSTRSPRAQVEHAHQVKYVLEGAPDHVVDLAVRNVEMVVGWERGFYAASNVPLHGRERIPPEAVQGILLAGEGLLLTLMAYSR